MHQQRFGIFLLVRFRFLCISIRRIHFCGEVHVAIFGFIQLHQRFKNVYTLIILCCNFLAVAFNLTIGPMRFCDDSKGTG